MVGLHKVAGKFFFVFFFRKYCVCLTKEVVRGMRRRWRRRGELKTCIEGNM